MPGLNLPIALQCGINFDEVQARAVLVPSYSFEAARAFLVDRRA